jgi:hypothetical protein
VDSYKTPTIIVQQPEQSKFVQPTPKQPAKEAKEKIAWTPIPQQHQREETAEKRQSQYKRII